MDSAKYHQLPDLPDLPEPDYFEIELDKIYGPPPTRLSRFREWARRNVFLVALLTLFLMAAILYIGAKAASRPKLMGILRPESQAQFKQAASIDESKVPDGLWSAPPPDDSSDGDHIIVDVAGSDVLNTNEDDVVLDAPSTNNSTNVMTSPEDANRLQDDTSQASKETYVDHVTASKSPVRPIATPQPTTTKQPVAPPPDHPTVQEDKGQVAISEPTPEEKEPYVPIRATFFSSTEGPKSCRGYPIAVIDLPKPIGVGIPSRQQCFNFALQQASGCALFMANKADGCIASVYAETNCRTYTNTVAFMAEKRPVGGHWRSVMVQCGVPEPDPATLGQPPMMDQMSSIVDNDKAKGG